MTKDVATWLIWLIQQQSISLSSPDARTHAELASKAMMELNSIIQGGDDGDA